MASFLEQAQSESQWKARTPCMLGLALSKLTDAQQADVQEALDDDEIRGAAITRTLHKVFDISVSERSVNRHRKSMCQCGRVIR